MIEREREISAVWMWARDERAQLSAATVHSSTAKHSTEHGT